MCEAIRSERDVPPAVSAGLVRRANRNVVSVHGHAALFIAMVTYGAGYNKMRELVTGQPSMVAMKGPAVRITHPAPMLAPSIRAVSTRQL